MHPFWAYGYVYAYGIENRLINLEAHLVRHSGIKLDSVT